MFPSMGDVNSSGLQFGAPMGSSGIESDLLHAVMLLAVLARWSICCVPLS